MKPIKQRHKRLTRFVIPMVLSALLCITSPVLARVSPNPTPTSTEKAAASGVGSVEQQARSLYSKRQFSEAAKLFQQAAQAYQASGEPIRQALSLSNLSLCYQQLGQWNDATSAIADSLALLEGAKAASPEKSLALAQVLDIQGGLLLARGKADAALKSWERATVLYTQQGKQERALTSQINQAQALQNLGLYRRAIALLDTALKLQQRSNTNEEQLQTLIKNLPPSPETVTALRTLGDSLRVTGNFTQARIVLEHSLAIANSLQLPEAVALAQLSLGNTARAQGDPQAALKYYQQAASTASPTLQVQAQVNQLSLLIDTKQPSAAQTLLPQVQQQIEALPPNRVSIEARVNLAQSIMEMESKPAEASLRRSAQILATAIQQAKELGDSHTLAYALGSLGNIYEKTEQWSEAEKLTQQALQLAQQTNAAEIAYRWQWQLGRVLKAQGKTTGAIAAYKGAVATIKSLRADLAVANPDVQFSFRSAVEPIHRQLVGLLVKSNQPDNLKEARDVIENLQLVELDNFFREACINGNIAQVDRVDQRAAVIYPILLEDELAIIASLPPSENQKQTKASREFRYYKTSITSTEVERFVSNLREELDQPTTLQLTLRELQQLYNWLIRPAASELAASKVETLVFVLDGALRNIPMAALHDGQKFLVEKYSIALTPGLQLLSPRSLKQEQLGALVAGLEAERHQGFSALPHVAEEVNQIKSKIPSQILFNQKFTSSAFETKVAAVSLPIVHLATHSQFSSEADETFILTWDGKIKVNDLSQVLQTGEISRDKALELLVLSACETAAGDNRSALGLAGVAVRSGARSTLATLWRVNDEASATLMGEFYNQLAQINKTGISKAEALRRAQLAILANPKYRQEPYFWAAYVLIGNWI
ncbi:hypothetical protein NUACC21_51860 [Scytonema sp. NUACC21]